MTTHVTMDKAYPWLISEVEMNGTLFEPRGKKCLEVRPYSFCILDPSRSLITNVKRRLNYRFFAIETLGYICGESRSWYMDLLCSANSKMEPFRGPDGCLSGAYGPRLNQSWMRVWDLLKKDPNTRQAVMSIWDSKEETELNLPCTLSLHFIKNDLGLSLVTTMRSNDLNWGVPNDVAAFCTILCSFADIIGMETGAYYHHAGSFHLYKEDDSQNEKPPSVGQEFIEIPPIPKNNASDWPSFQAACSNLLWSLNENRLAGNKWKDFEYSTQNELLKWMIDLVKFSWKDHGN